MLGFMFTTMFLSMWISNTAATALMVPIVDSVCEAMFETNDLELGEREETKPRPRSQVQEVKRNLMLLSCAYAANIGGETGWLNLITVLILLYLAGTGVITGTPPNLVVLSTLDSDYGSGKAIIFILRHNVETGFVAGDHPMSYATWMAFCVPLMLVNTVIAWLMILIIQRLTLGREEEEEGNQELTPGGHPARGH